MLAYNPDDRLFIEEIKRHAWMKNGVANNE